MQSDVTESPTHGKRRSKVLNNDNNDFNQVSEPKCVDSLCNSINTRLKLLENEIFSQHKVWETIQREIVEVKSLIEDCASTGESSSISAQDNESDSEWDAHDECTHSLWNRLQKAEQKLQQKKAAMQALARQISRIKHSNKNGRRKAGRSSSNVDLILEVTNGLQYLKCDKCKFCNEHLDFRKGLVSSVIDLIHFNEKNSSSTSEENQTLKGCLQKICSKMRSCYLHSHSFTKSHHQHPADGDYEKFNIESVYKTLDDFCQHFQKLQDELMRLNTILSSSEDGQVEDGCNNSHSTNCKSISLDRGRDESDYYDDDDTKLYKTSKKIGCAYERKLKVLTHDETEDFYLDRRQDLETNTYNPEAQLRSLRSRIFDAVHLVRDVDVEYNNDESLIAMVGSLSEECSALRQEVSYLRNVRQEKKKAWNKLQCFVMDAERKLKANDRSIPNLREVIRDLGDMIASSDSSSLDETVLYMYSNQLEWLEKLLTGYESPTKNTNKNNTECETFQPSRTVQKDDMPSNSVGTQTSITPFHETIGSELIDCLKTKTCEIAVQADETSWWTSKGKVQMLEPRYAEINRDIYILPEVQEENDALSVINSYQGGKYSSHSSSGADAIGYDFSSHGSFYDNSNALSSFLVSRSQETLQSDSDQNILSISAMEHRDILPNIIFESISSAEPTYNDAITRIPDSSSSFGFSEEGLCAVQALRNPVDFVVSNYDDKNICFYIFPQNNSNLTSLFSDILYNVFKDSLKYTNFLHQDYNWSCFLLNSKHSAESNINSVKCLPFSMNSDFENEEGLCQGEDTKALARVSGEMPCPDNEALLKAALIDRYLLSSISNSVEFLPNTTPRSFPRICNEEESFCFPTINIHTSSEKQRIEDIAKVIPLNTTSEQDGPPALTRSNTFTQENMESFPSLSAEEFLAKSFHSSGDSFLFTSVLSQVATSDENTFERNYTLYEVDGSSTKDSTQILGSFLEPNLSFPGVSNKRYFLCESGVSEKLDARTSEKQKASNVVVFSKGILDLQRDLTSDTPSQCSIFPLLPSYLPFGNLNQPSLTHSCEIYDISSFDNISKKDEVSVFIPKQFLKMRTSHPLLQNTSPETSPRSDEENFVENALEGFEQEQNHSSRTLSDQTAEKGTQVETKCASTQTMETLDNTEIQETTSENVKAEKMEFVSTNHKDAEPSEHELEDTAQTENQKEESLKTKSEQNVECVSQEVLLFGQEPKSRETCLLDEISALKENLSQQNAVLQRLKEQSEETNSHLILKESKITELETELNKLNEDSAAKVTSKNSEDKICQTSIAEGIENYDALQSELKSLRQENQNFCQKITRQTNAIQNIKIQLATTIAHLKNLKDGAAKQLKKQKNQHLKAVKLKQQLQEAKAELAKRMVQLQKKDEQISDQEFCLQEVKARLEATVEELNESKLISKNQSENLRSSEIGCQTEGEVLVSDKNEQIPDGNLPNATLEKHSELLLELQTKLQRIEAAFTSKKGAEKRLENHNTKKPSSESKVAEYLKDGNLWKLLTISEQSYLNLVSKLTDSLQISDLKGSTALMHSSWLNCDDLADSRRQDHQKILQNLEKLKKNLFYVQESVTQEQRSQISENNHVDERKSGNMCHSEESHFRYLCEVLQKAQENVAREFGPKRPTPTQQRTVVTAGSGRTSRHVVSRERKIPLELKNGKILALLDNKVTQKDILPNKQDYNRMESKSGN